MLRLLRRSFRFATAPRRQNFFQLNPIYPDAGQKDFDIYNVNYNHIPSGPLAVKDQQRYMQLKQKLTNEIYLKTVNDWDRNKTGDEHIDQETGFPVGIHQDFDAFIEIFKRQKKVGSNVVGDFHDLVMSLMRKFEAKSEIELIKIFRINLANIKKNSLKDKLRGLLVNSAFLKFVKEKNFKIGSQLSYAQLEPFFQESQQKKKKEKDGDTISQLQLQEIAFRSALKDLDTKINSIEDQIHKQALANGTFVPTFHPKYGQAITEEQDINVNYDLKNSRGFSRKITTNQSLYTSAEQQDRFIESRINKLFFLQALKQVQGKKQVEAAQLAKLHNLPVHIRSRDKIINSLLYRYKEYDLLVEPDLQDIYQEVDMALKKIVVKVVPDYLDNQKENNNGGISSKAEVKERILSKQTLLWQRLDVEEIFDPQYYDQQSVEKVKIQQKQIAEISPSTTLELTLNKMPMNLYRHADLDQFGVFNKYRKFIYKDCITDRTIDPQVQFKYFSLEEAQSTLKKVKKTTEITDKYYGFAKRKSGQAEVYITKGNGKVIVNGQPLADYFGDLYHRGEALKPLIFTQTAGQFDLDFTVVGGGIHSQSQCMAMALTNALIMFNPKYENILSQFGMTGIDDRKNQSKKMGLYTARVRPPFVRR